MEARSLMRVSGSCSNDYVPLKKQPTFGRFMIAILPGLKLIFHSVHCVILWRCFSQGAPRKSISLSHAMHANTPFYRWIGATPGSCSVRICSSEIFLILIFFAFQLLLFRCTVNKAKTLHICFLIVRRLLLDTTNCSVENYFRMDRYPRLQRLDADPNSVTSSKIWFLWFVYIRKFPS